MQNSFKASILSKLDIPEGKLLVAFSGGSDSLALLYILSLLAKDRTAALYVNHNIRKSDELDEEIKLNKKNAESLGIPLDVITLEKGLVDKVARESKCGIEAAARRLRYSALEEYREKHAFSYILTAHHREDQVESFIMRSLDAAPLYSLSGIQRSDGYLYRPLLSLSKKDILFILSSASLSWSEDSTNRDDEYRRNRIRHNILPLITEHERELISSISENIQSFRNRYNNMINANFGFYASIDKASFITAPRWCQDDIIYRINSYFGNKERVSRAFIDEIISASNKQSSKIIKKDMTVYVLKDSIRFYPSLWDFVVPFNSHKAGPFEVVKEKEDDKTLIVDTSSISQYAIFRSSRPLDEIELKEGKKKVSELEKEYKVPSSIVLEDRGTIIALFARIYGGKDRLSKAFLGREGEYIALKYS